MKISIPKIEIVSEPKLQYEYGDNISITVASPNYTGRVEYRVMLYNGTTGKTTELWNIPVTGNYYTSWRPDGSYKFQIHWPVIQMESGAYSMTVLVRRAGTRINYDSYADTRTFWVIGNYMTVGRIDYPNGDSYSGEQINGVPEGNGTMLWINGDKYIGEFKNGLMDGKGNYIWANGDRYKGEFKNSKKHGQGVMTWNNGDIYEGQFINDEINGQGTMIYSNGSRLEGTWERGVLVKPAIDPPADIRANVVLENQIQVGWNLVANADYYYVYYSYSFNGYYNCLTDYDGKKISYGWNSGYSAVIDNVPYNTTVYIKVTAVKNGFESEYSNIISVTTSKKYYEYYPYNYWHYYGYPYDYPYGYVYQYPYEYQYNYPYSLIVDSNIHGHFYGFSYHKEYVLINGQVWRQISNTNINAVLYMPRVLVYSINGNYVMWVEGLNEPIYVERIR